MFDRVKAQDMGNDMVKVSTMGLFIAAMRD